MVGGHDPVGRMTAAAKIGIGMASDAIDGLAASIESVIVSVVQAVATGPDIVARVALLTGVLGVTLTAALLIEPSVRTVSVDPGRTMINWSQFESAGMAHSAVLIVIDGGVAFSAVGFARK